MNTPVLLSIAIPTWNRSPFLQRTLSELGRLLTRLGQTMPVDRLLEVVISDNGSSDGTPAVVAEAKEAIPCRLVYHRNAVNIGVSRNIMGLLDLVSGTYFLFIGDDDHLNADGLTELLRVLKDGRRPLAATIEDPSVGGESRFFHRAAAYRYFYDYGNAYKGCVKTELARQAMSAHGLLPRLAQLVWPQTVFGFVGMHLAPSDHRVAVIRRTIGSSPFHQELNIKSFEYYARSFFDLIEAGVMVDGITGRRRAVCSLLSLHSEFLFAHVRGMCMTSLLHTVDETKLARRFQRLRHAAGVRGWWTWLVLRFLLCKPVTWIAGISFMMLLKRVAPWTAIGLLAQQRVKYRKSVDAARNRPAVRVSNYFDPD